MREKKRKREMKSQSLKFLNSLPVLGKLTTLFNNFRSRIISYIRYL